MAHRTFTQLKANAVPPDGKTNLHVSLWLSCPLLTLFPPVYHSSSSLPLVGPRLWEVVSLEVLSGKGPGDEESVSSLVQGRLCLEN